MPKMLVTYKSGKEFKSVEVRWGIWVEKDAIKFVDWELTEHMIPACNLISIQIRSI